MLKLKNGEVVMKALLKDGTVLTSALYLFPSMATAQDQPPATTPTQSIASRGSAEAVGGARLGDIVLTARRRATNAQTVPVRSEERRGWEECVSECRSRWSRYHYKNNKKQKIM